MTREARKGRLNRLAMRLRRWWAAVSQPGTGGLVQPGDWRCQYPDGKKTWWMSHGDAENCRALYGGDLEWRGDAPNTEARAARSGRVERYVGPAYYVTQAGETLMGIALRQLKNENRWREIADLNSGRFPDMGPHNCYPPLSTVLLPNTEAQSYAGRVPAGEADPPGVKGD